jgi:GNAT superfamily N-acetyltransferase
MSAFTIRPTGPADEAWVAAWMREHWGDEVMALRGELLRPAECPGFVAQSGDEMVGLATYFFVDATTCELLSLDSLRSGQGIGGALIDAVADVARAAGRTRLRLITTNDNLHALGFYQRRGFRIVGVNPGAVDQARATIKPAIPQVAENGIPISDEIELAIEL